jgi:hypothetical protein
MNNDNSKLLMGLSWINAGLGTLFSNLEPLLANLAYLGSIIGSGVYIYVTLKQKNKKND